MILNEKIKQNTKKIKGKKNKHGSPGLLQKSSDTCLG
jgi:hypothetical protein